jgi:hypothetical protein
MSLHLATIQLVTLVKPVNFLIIYFLVLACMSLY